MLAFPKSYDPTTKSLKVGLFRYYDPASDGFFYEMASVDGWRRRQTQPAAAVYQQRVPPVQSPQSYGAALARLEMPTRYVVDSSASSSASEELLGATRLSRPASFSMITDDEELNGEIVSSEERGRLTNKFKR